MVTLGTFTAQLHQFHDIIFVFNAFGNDRLFKTVTKGNDGAKNYQALLAFLGLDERTVDLDRIKRKPHQVGKG